MKKKMMNKVSYIVSGGVINLVINNKVFTVTKDHVNHSTIVEALKAKNKNVSKILALVDVGATVEKKAKGRVIIKNGRLYFNNIELHDYCSTQILEMIKNKFDVTYLIRFLEKIMNNPLPDIRTDLYTWLEKYRMPITPDGDFLAYKRVTSNFRDFYSGKFDNSVGKVVKMPWKECDIDRDNSCSRGLHAASFEYMSTYHGGQGTIIIVKVNPKNVCAIPSDCNGAKFRSCEYKVVGCHTEGEKVDTLKNTLVNKDYTPVRKAPRDSKGRFVSKSDNTSIVSDPNIINKSNSPKRDSRGRFIKTNS